jgi:hypothetical protein
MKRRRQSDVENNSEKKEPDSLDKSIPDLELAFIDSGINRENEEKREVN